MAKISKEDLVEKLKGMSKEDRGLFRDALSEIEPGEGLSMEEVSTIREMLAKSKDGKTKKPKSFLDSILGE